MKTVGTSRHPDGFTLIELVISSSLGALILVSAYLCLNSAIAGRKMIEPRIEAFQNARVAMAIMTADLRAACPLDPDFMLLGMPRTMGEMEADNLDFATHNYMPQRENEGDFCEVSYFVNENPRTGGFDLWRRRNPTLALDPLSGGYREQIARGVRGLQFEYYDGYDWYDTWGDVNAKQKQESSRRERYNLSGMPEAIRITLLMDPNPHARSTNEMAAAEAVSTNEPPLVFQSVVRLNLAAVSSKGGLSTGAGNDQDDSSAQGTQTMRNGGVQ